MTSEISSHVRTKAMVGPVAVTDGLQPPSGGVRWIWACTVMSAFYFLFKVALIVNV